MLFMLLVSLLLLLLQFNGQLFVVFCSIFKVQPFKAFYFHPPLLWSCMHTLMLIMTMTPLIASLLLVFASFWVIILFLGRVRNNLLLVYLQLKRRFVIWILLPKRLFGYIGYLQIWEYFFLIPLLCIVTTRVLFKLLTTQFFINKPSILRLIVTLHVNISSMAPLLCLLFLLRCS